MSIQSKIQEDLKSSLKSKDSVKKNCLKYIIGEFQREKNKVLNDDKVTIILKKLKERITEEIESYNKKGLSSENQKIYLDIIKSYIPIQKSHEEIVKWIKENVDFSKYKRKIEAMKEIMFHFGITVDGSAVKEILLNEID